MHKHKEINIIMWFLKRIPDKIQDNVAIQCVSNASVKSNMTKHVYYSWRILAI